MGARLGDTRDVFLGHGASLDVGSEFKSRAGLAGLEADADLGKLAGAAALLLVHVFDVGHLADRLAVVHLRRAHVALHLHARIQIQTSSPVFDQWISTHLPQRIEASENTFLSPLGNFLVHHRST